VVQEGCQVALLANKIRQVLHGIAQLHDIGANAVAILHFVSFEVLDLVIEHREALLVQLFRLILLAQQSLVQRLLL